MRIQKFLNEYPHEKEVRNLLYSNNNEDLICFIQQWISEGIPYAFRHDPFLFERFRRELAKRLMINPKEITVIGSARIGYSLSPPPQYGKMFNHESDLDLSIVSRFLFDRCKTEQNIWVREYEEGKIIPRNPREEKFWKINLTDNNHQINKGFIDSHRVPNLYTTFSLLNNSIWFVTKYLKEKNTEIAFKKISIRVYKDWNCFLNQQERNLKLLHDKISG